MKLYPQCRNGLFPPMITAIGQVIPCCMQNYKPISKNIRGEIIENAFASPEHNIYNRSFGEIVESESWKTLLNNLETIEDIRCKTYCSKKVITPWNRFYDEQGQNQEYKEILTKDYESLQIELTNFCTLKCQYCRRQSDPFRLNKDQIDLDRLWDAISYKKWKVLIDCSIYGDPIWYDKLPDLLDRMILNPPVKQYSIHLAATGRGLEYWKNIVDKWGKLQSRGVNVDLYFGIDGPKEVSELHRKNQNWDEITGALIMVSERTDITPILKFIPFKWNEHHIDYMMLLAEKWGARFYLKKSDRFTENDPNRPLDSNLYYDYWKKYDIDRTPLLKNLK